MKKVIFLSSKNYNDPSKNCGDCILIDNSSELVIFDCGCEDHAKQVENYMIDHNYDTAKIVLSHNDADHFDGIPYLVDKGLISEVYTLLLLKYKDDLLNLIDDGRRNRNSIAKSIEEIYDNIYSLSGKVTLKDIFTDTTISSDIIIPGPDKDYSLNAIAKNIDSRETIVNAVSTQVSVTFTPDKKLLLTGDSSFKAIENNIKNHSAIQLPHHGKLDQAEDIFSKKDNHTIYYVSDNTGSSNGGSDKLREKYPRGHIIYNTLNGEQVCTSNSFKVTTVRGSYFWGE